MPFKFRYWAKNNKGESADGEIEALDIEEAKKKLREQGLSVESINIALDQTLVVKQVSKTKEKEKPAGEQAQARFDWKKNLPYLGAGAVILLLLILVPVLSGGLGERVDTRVKYEVAKFDDYSVGDTIRLNFFITIADGSKEGEMKYVAKKVFDEAQGRMASLSQAMFSFFYKGQDFNTAAPVAVLKWNWDNSGIWDYKFSSSNSGQ